MTRFRICITTSLICIGTTLIPASLIYAKERTPAQQAAMDKCVVEFRVCEDACTGGVGTIGNPPPGTFTPCQDDCLAKAGRCLEATGAYMTAAQLRKIVMRPRGTAPLDQSNPTAKPTAPPKVTAPKDKSNPTPKATAPLDKSTPTPTPTPQKSKG